MTYLALLRGINVGGKNRVDMGRLRAAFEGAGMTSVTTYINSGNVVFEDTAHEPSQIPSILESAIADEFDLAIRVLIRDRVAIDRLAAILPHGWVNDKMMKCDVMFLWEEIDHPDVVGRLNLRDGIDDVIYTPGAIIWRVDRSNQTRSGQTDIVGTDLYKKMTVRNVNTTRKLIDLIRS